MVASGGERHGEEVPDSPGPGLLPGRHYELSPVEADGAYSVILCREKRTYLRAAWTRPGCKGNDRRRRSPLAPLAPHQPRPARDAADALERGGVVGGPCRVRAGACAAERDRTGGVVQPTSKSKSPISLIAFPTLALSTLSTASTDS